MFITLDVILSIYLKATKNSIKIINNWNFI